MDSETPFQPWASKDSAKSVKNEKDLGDAKLHRENVNQPKHTQTASYDKESASVSSTASGPSSAETPAPGPSRGKESKMDPVKIASMQQIVENTLSPEGRQRVVQLLEAVEALSGPERLLLYLRLPTGVPPHDPLKQPINPLGSRAELQQTVTWIQTHLEVDPDVSLPKQDVYDEYIAHCMNSNMKPLSTADFGKVMKQVYPSVRPRRLGTRGNSRYCYAGLRKKIKLEVPQLPDLGESSQEPIAPLRESDRIVCDWAESKLGVHFASVAELSRHLSTRTHIAPGPPSASPPRSTHGHIDDAASRQLMKQLKRKIQTQGTPGRPKKNKAPEITGELPPSTSYPLAPPPPHAPPPPPQAPPPLAVKHEGEPEYYPPYPLYEGYPAPYPPPPRLDYRDPYAFEPYSHDNLPINLSSDASLDLSTERDWRRRPTSPPARPLPGKKLILEAYQSEARPPSPPAQYLPKKMRAAESLGRLAAEQAPPPPDPFLEDPKNSANRSKGTAAALARERRQAASPPRAPSAGCCDVAGVICKERHSEILNRERVISICNIDKHDLDDYLNEGSSQEHEEELLQYFQKQRPAPDSERPQNFLDPAQDPQDDHSQGKNEKISQLRELLARNLKNQSGSGPQAALSNQKTHPETSPAARERPEPADGALRPLPADPEPACADAGSAKLGNSDGKEAVAAPFDKAQALPAAAPAPLYNGNCHTEPQSPTTRTQQYDFVPISDGCHSPGNGFNQRGHSPVKVNKPALMSSSLQTSPISHSTAASPFVSPRNTPVPRSRLCSRPIPKLNGRKRRNPLSLGMADSGSKFVMPNEKLKGAMCVTGVKYCPMSAPPSPNILTHFKNQIFQCHSGMPNGSATNVLSFLPNAPFREHMNGEIAQPLSADPLSSEVSQFFQEPIMSFRPGHDPSFRSQSVPLKPGINNIGLMSYNNTPVGSVPPTPVPNEFCDFADTCDISKAGLNSETLDKIYDAIDSSNEVLNSNVPTALLNSNDTLTNGCDALSEQQILTEDHLNSFIPGGDLLDRTHQFTQSFTNVGGTGVELINEELLKRANSIEFDPSDLVTEKNKYYNNTSRSVPSTPLPYRRTAPNLQIDPQRSRELFPETNSAISNGISSKSVPSTPQLVEKRVFSYSNKDFLINGNSVEVCPSAQLHGAVLSDEQGLTSPLHDMLREDILVEPLTPATDLLADFDKIGGTPYGDL